MPRGPLVGNHVTEVIIEDINDLIIGDWIVVSPCRLLIQQQANVVTNREAYPTYHSLQFCTRNLV